jgi:hypothetical protein
MTDRYESVGQPPEVSGDTGSPVPTNPEAQHRIVLLECRLEQVRSALDEARSEADRARARLAEAHAREADYARRVAGLHEELATAREEAVVLHRRLEHSEALRAGLEGNLFGAETADDAEELIRLRREASSEHERAIANERTLTDLRARVEELVASRETVLTRVAEWQRSTRDGDEDAFDLAEFISALRKDILELERRTAQGERREAKLRERLEEAEQARAAAAIMAAPRSDVTSTTAEAGAAAVTPSPTAGRPADATVFLTGGPVDDLVAALAAAETLEVQVALLGRLGRSGHLEAFEAIRAWAAASDPLARAAAYEALGRLLERDPARLEPYVRWGLADGDARVRRRVALAAATARGLALRPLLEPLQADPDPQVRRVVQEVLRRAPPAAEARLQSGEAEPVPSEVAAVVSR